MTSFNYVTATVSDLERKAEGLGLSIFVTRPEAAEYLYAGPERLVSGEIPEGLRRLTLLARIAIHDFEKSTTPPEFLVQYASRIGLTEFSNGFAAKEIVLNFVRRNIGSYATRYMNCNIASRTTYIGVVAGFSHQVRPFARNIESSGAITRIYTDGTVVERTQDPSTISCPEQIKAYYWNPDKCRLGFVISTGESSWHYFEIVARQGGEAGRPEFGHRSSDFSDLVCVSEWFNLAGGGLSKKLVLLSLNQLRLNFSSQGLFYQQSLRLGEKSAEIRIDLDSNVDHGDLCRLAKSSRDIYGFSGIQSCIETQSLSRYLESQARFNELLQPDLLCISDDGAYFGPRHFAEDPVSALTIAYFQENRKLIPAKSRGKDALKKQVRSMLGGALVNKETEASIDLQLAYMESMALSREGAALQSLLSSKSVAETVAYLEMKGLCQS